MIFIKITSHETSIYIEQLKLIEHYAIADKIAGSRTHHCFIPNHQFVDMRIISAGKVHSSIPITNSKTSTISVSCFKPGMYVACIYDGDWYIGIVLKVSVKYNEIHVKFMTKEGKCFIWPRKNNQCWVPQSNCLGQVESLVTQGHEAHTYGLSA